MATFKIISITAMIQYRTNCFSHIRYRTICIRSYSNTSVAKFLKDQKNEEKRLKNDQHFHKKSPKKDLPEEKKTICKFKCHLIGLLCKSKFKCHLIGLIIGFIL